MAHKTYIKDTNGTKAVLFIHGFLGSTEHFEEFIKLLPGNVSVYNILLKGHGGSVKDFAKASMQQWKNQVNEVFASLCLKYDSIYIAAHSMGTFFAMDCAVKVPDKVKGLFLLQSPLKIGLKPRALVGTFKSFFNIFGDDEVGRAYKNAHSVKLNFRLWEYMGWIPRYLELFRESKVSRTVITNVKTPCLIFQSAKDELVSLKSVKFVPENGNIELNILKNSAHFIYDKKEMDFMKKAFLNMIGK